MCAAGQSRWRWPEGEFVTSGCRGKSSCRSASKVTHYRHARSAEPSGATLRCAPPALALRPHNLEGGQLFDADPGQSFGAV